MHIRAAASREKRDGLPEAQSVAWQLRQAGLPVCQYEAAALPTIFTVHVNKSTGRHMGRRGDERQAGKGMTFYVYP